MTRTYSLTGYHPNPFGFDAVEAELWAAIVQALREFIAA
jgi:hypothetical protein